LQIYAQPIGFPNLFSNNLEWYYYLMTITVPVVAVMVVVVEPLARVWVWVWVWAETRVVVMLPIRHSSSRFFLIVGSADGGKPTAALATMKAVSDQ